MHLLLAIVVFSLLQMLVVKPFQVPSASMQPTLQETGFGDRILVERVSYAVSTPVVGDVIVFSRPAGWPGHTEHTMLRTVLGVVGDVLGFGPSNLDPLVKRVIAGPGDIVQCCDELGRVLVNGVALDEPYVAFDAPFSGCEEPASPRCFGPVVVPDDSWFVLGDHRANSRDSASACRGQPGLDHCAVFVRSADLIGRAFAIVLPLERLGPISSGSG